MKPRLWKKHGFWNCALPGALFNISAGNTPLGAMARWLVTYRIQEFKAFSATVYQRRLSSASADTGQKT